MSEIEELKEKLAYETAASLDYADAYGEAEAVNIIYQYALTKIQNSPHLSSAELVSIAKDSLMEAFVYVAASKEER